MRGAIAGDIIGSIYEGSPIKTKQFPLFGEHCSYTDDSVLTVATADHLLYGGGYAPTYRAYARRYPNAGYGGLFSQWMRSQEMGPYNSWGNGSAMRVSPIGFAFDSLEEALDEARRSAAVTHNHPEGIKGAQATVAAIVMGRQGFSREQIAGEIAQRFGYDLSRCLDEIRPHYSFKASCQETVPEAIIALLESSDWEDAVRNAISLGGDADTLACITGGMAEAFYGGVPGPIEHEVRSRLTNELNNIVCVFREKYALP